MACWLPGRVLLLRELARNSRHCEGSFPRDIVALAHCRLLVTLRLSLLMDKVQLVAY